jgi:hypothetical protein
VEINPEYLKRNKEPENIFMRIEPKDINEEGKKQNAENIRADIKTGG